MYTQVKFSIYNSSDRELLDSKNRMGIVREIENTSNNMKPENEPSGEFKKDEKRVFNNVNIRVTYIIKDESGNIVSKSPLAEYFENEEFDKDDLNTIYSKNIDGYNYRVLNYTFTKNQSIYYVQALVNTDAEEDIMRSFTIMLIIVLIVCIAISLFVSYVLSKKTLKPIITSWRKQTEFVQNASHELRTPLTIIQAKQQLLLENPESKIIDNTEDIGITINETKRLSKLVKELMELANDDSNKLVLNKERIEIDKLIEEVSEMFREIAISQNKKFELDLNYKKEAFVDESKIRELLYIILDNSMKYTLEGDTIIIRTREKDSRLVIDIKDTGIGISDEAIDHIFERFYREDKAHTRETGGSGLGLSIANSIVQAHGGTIKALHNKPKGTIFEIKLK